MFTDKLFRPKAPNDALFHSRSAETPGIFQNICLESIREAKKKALHLRVLSPRKAGISQPTEIVLDSTGNSKPVSSCPNVNEPTLLYETDQGRLHQHHKILNMAGEGHFGKVYKVISSQDGIIKAAKVATSRSRLFLTQTIRRLY